MAVSYCFIPDKQTWRHRWWLSPTVSYLTNISDDQTRRLYIPLVHHLKPLATTNMITVSHCFIGLPDNPNDDEIWWLHITVFHLTTIGDDTGDDCILQFHTWPPLATTQVMTVSYSFTPDHHWRRHRWWLYPTVSHLTTIRDDTGDDCILQFHTWPPLAMTQVMTVSYSFIPDHHWRRPNMASASFCFIPGNTFRQENMRVMSCCFSTSPVCITSPR